MAIAPSPSSVFVPVDTDPQQSVLQFLAAKFDHIPQLTWQQRIEQGKVSWANGSVIQLGDLCVPGQKLCYFREVVQEPEVPFHETIIYQNERILIADKPHFLPVVPGGGYVQQCLLNRLRQSTGIGDLSPAHRIDLDTAGLVLFVKQAEDRACYQRLFATGGISKQYEAVVRLQHDVSAPEVRQCWQIKNRMASSIPSFWMQIVEGEDNSHTEAQCIARDQQRAMFRLSPITGKRHQLRLHMASLGFGLENDRFYPELQPPAAPDFDKPLQLLARSLHFTDPVSGEALYFESVQRLKHCLLPSVDGENG